MGRRRPPTPEQGCAWITGASSGIGEAVAIRLARDGWQVMASARRAPVLADLAGRHPGIHPWPLDVTDRAAVAATVAAITARHGPIALAILNAGTYQRDAAEGFAAPPIAAQVGLNLMGVVHGLETLLPAMIARGGGHLQVVSSVAGYRGLPGAAGYAASKAAVIALCESLWFDLDRAGVRLQLVNPGFVRTPLTDRNDFPMPFLIDAETAAHRMVDGLRRSSFEISFPRRFTWLMKALRCLPYPLYFPLVRAITGR